jgi:hypothetical protein
MSERHEPLAHREAPCLPWLDENRRSNVALVPSGTDSEPPGSEDSFV